MHGVYPVLLLAAVGILSGVVVVAMGRGGEIVPFRRDVPEFMVRIRTPQDVAMLRLPIGLLGYSAPASADALRAIASLLAERDAEIAVLRGQVALLTAQGPAATALAAAPRTTMASDGVPGSDQVPADEAGMTAAQPAAPS
jgi:hypothetical protein